MLALWAVSLSLILLSPIRDSMVYYWRVSLVRPVYWIIIGRFVFHLSERRCRGFNQSHYFQQQKSEVERISLEADRTWNMATGSIIYLSGTQYITLEAETRE